MRRRRLATSITVSETSGSCSQSRTRRLLRVVRMPKPCSIRHRSGIGTKPLRCCARLSQRQVDQLRHPTIDPPQPNNAKKDRKKQLQEVYTNLPKICLTPQAA